MVTLQLTDEQAKNLDDVLHYVRDEGPEDEGWQSAELVELRELVCKTISCPLKPAPAKFSEQELLRRGYKEFSLAGNPEHADQWFQRRIFDANDSRKTLYFINVYRYTVNSQNQWAAHTQFNFEDGPTLNLDAFNTDDLDQCEGLIAKAFVALDAKPYDSD